MNSVIGGLFVSGRSTARSIVMPRTTMIAKVIDKGYRERHATLNKAHECQRRKQEKRALRKVQDTRCLVNQHEADRDERIHDPEATRRPAPR